jgi:signal transduction histidine kinase
MAVLAILGLAIGLQAITAIVVRRLIRVTGSPWAWVALAAVVVLLTGWRCTVVLRGCFDGVSAQPDLATEGLVLLISLCMVSGLVGIASLILSLQRAQEAAQQTVAAALRAQQQEYETIFHAVPSEIRFKDTNNRLVRVNRVAAILDINKRIATNEDMASLLAQSERTNTMLRNESAEMERFTYTVSHDLKSPLITIQGFLGLLEKDAMAGNIAQMQTDMTYIRAAASTMQRLLNELLELSRIGRVVNPLTEVALSELAQEAVTLVSGQITARGVQVHIAPDLPVVIGDRPRLLEVLQNLLDNAVKFMGAQPQPCINFGVRRDAQEAVCYVRDNGIGIAPRYHEKVFGLFERLDGASDGTGIGLTLVKRIIEVHGGRIWVESAGEGHGSTFCFTVSCPSPGAPERLTPSA